MTTDAVEPEAVAFCQNSRDEVRMFGGDGSTVGALSASPGAKQTCYEVTQYGEELAGTLSRRADGSPCADCGPNVLCAASDTANAAMDDDVCGSLMVGGGGPYVVARRTASTSSGFCAHGTTRASVTST